MSTEDNADFHKARPVVQVEVADLHINSKRGLCPPVLTLNDGGGHLATKVQTYIYNLCWKSLFLEAWQLKTELNALLYVVIAGDAGDLNTHDGADLISKNPADEVDTIYAVLSKPREMADEFFMVRGTEAHGGPQNSLEEVAAQMLHATPDDEAGTASWWILKQDVCGIKSHIAHHTKTYGFLPWTRQSAAMRLAMITRNNYFDMGDPPPDRAVFAHGHYFADSGTSTVPRVYYLPSWQLTTAYGYRRGAGERIEPVGGLITIFKDGKWKTLIRRWEQRPKRWWTRST